MISEMRPSSASLEDMRTRTSSRVKSDPQPTPVEVCPSCGVGLTTRTETSSQPRAKFPAAGFTPTRYWRFIWIASFAVWIALSFAAAISVYELYRGEGSHLTFTEALIMQFSQLLPFAPLTPLVFALVYRYPINRSNWIRRSAIYLVGGLLFTLCHVTLRGFTPYGMWDPKARKWHSAVWNSQTHKIDIRPEIYKGMFLVNVFEDITGTYIPIVLAAYLVSYYSRLKDQDRLAADLETQLTKAHLRALKSQLQPHFLFNTMHSISGLMFSDTLAADKMMSRLGELLRMSLEDGHEQMTTLSRELEFVNGYLEIEKMRFGERLSVELKVAPETLDAEVPHLLLQPFVENALQHGLANLPSGGRIAISSAQEGHELRLSVEDNGRGFQDFNGESSGFGLGIRTSQERLSALYGKDQTLTFASPPNNGTQVTIRLPFRLITGKE